MGITFSLLEKLREHGVWGSGTSWRVLDIGSSNLYGADEPGVLAFVRKFRSAVRETEPELAVFADRIAKGSLYDSVKGGLNEAFAGEVLERCGVDYLSFDIARGYKTEILDLNRQSLPAKYKKTFDAVLNIGTTEHVLNQYNSFEVIHDATKVGGYIVHQLPVAGFTDHGYFVYTGRLFFDIAAANGYEIVDLWYDGPAGNDELFTSIRSYEEYFPQLKQISGSVPVPNCAITIILRKTQDRPFAACLETTTSVGKIPDGVRQDYQKSLVARIAVAILGFRLARKIKQLLRMVAASVGFRS